MSKNSTKSQYEQLMAWLPTLNQPKVAKEHYKSKGAYGKAGN